MAVRVQIFPKKNFTQSSNHSRPHSSVNYPPWYQPEQEFTHSSSESLCLRAKSPTQLFEESKHLSFHLQDQDSLSTLSAGQSNQEVTVMERINSQDDNISSESVQDESIGKHTGGEMKPLMIMANPEFGMNAMQPGLSQSATHIPLVYADPYFNGLYTAYGPQVLIPPQMGGIGSSRMALPLDLPEDGPIYVNAKQYHGILRRRQTRAKLEAQNKLLKTRKPYLHESRHLHALNRVRGSGGRFLSTKKSEQTGCPDIVPSQRKDAAGIHNHPDGSKRDTVHSSCIGSTCATSGDSIFHHHQPVERRFSSIAPQMSLPVQSSRGFINSGAQHRAPVVW